MAIPEMRAIVAFSSIFLKGPQMLNNIPHFRLIIYAPVALAVCAMRHIVRRGVLTYVWLVASLPACPLQAPRLYSTLLNFACLSVWAYCKVTLVQCTHVDAVQKIKWISIGILSVPSATFWCQCSLCFIFVGVFTFEVSLHLMVAQG